MYPACFPRALPRDLSLNNSSALLGGRQNAPDFTSWPQPLAPPSLFLAREPPRRACSGAAEAGGVC